MVIAGQLQREPYIETVISKFYVFWAFVQQTTSKSGIDK